MLRKLVSISLIISIMVTLFRFTIPVTWYIANYDYIKSELCINRHIPGSDCDGTCQLRKKIHDNHDEHESESPKVHETAHRITLFYSDSDEENLRYLFNSLRFEIFQDSLTSQLSLEPPTPPPNILV